jgi:tetratricopeptide (TPR) repeat protein
MLSVLTKAATSSSEIFHRILRLTYEDPPAAVGLLNKISEPIETIEKIDWYYLHFRVHHKDGNNEAALNSAMKAKTLSEEVGDNFRLAGSLLACAKATFRAGNHTSSSDFANLALILSESLGDEQLIAECNYLLGNNYLELFDFEQSGKHLSKAAQVFEKTEQLDRTADCVLNLGVIEFMQGNYAEALSHYNRAILLRKEFRRASQNNEPSQFGELVFCFDRYIRIYLNNDSDIANSLYMAGTCYKSLGDFATATELVIESISISEQLNDDAGCARCFHLLGLIDLQKKSYESALNQFEKALNIFEKFSDPNSSITRLNIAGVQIAQGKIIEAVPNIEMARVEFVKRGEKFRIIESDKTLVVCYQKIGETAKSIEIATNSLASAHDMGLSESVLDLSVLLSNLKFSQGDSVSAIELASQALQLAESIGSKNAIYQIHEGLCKIFEATGDTKRALQHLYECLRVKDELFSEESDRRQKNLLILHEVEQHKRIAEESKAELQRTKQELYAKAQELAEFALRIIEKEEFLTMIETGLTRILKAREYEKNQLVVELIQKVKKEGNVASDWEVLRSQFQTLQNEFVLAISKQYPELSPTELKVCTLLRMNLRTKEIATILHINGKTVENHRISIRKKMGLDRDANLVHELLSVTELV